MSSKLKAQSSKGGIFDAGSKLKTQGGVGNRNNGMWWWEICSKVEAESSKGY